MDHLTEAAALAFVIQYFSEDTGLPTSFFSEKTNLITQLLYTPRSLVEVGKVINKRLWNHNYVTPAEMAACRTIGDIVGAIMNDQPERGLGIFAMEGAQ